VFCSDNDDRQRSLVKSKGSDEASRRNWRQPGGHVALRECGLIRTINREEVR
jgi:hypothetical protein